MYNMKDIQISYITYYYLCISQLMSIDIVHISEIKLIKI